MTYRYSRVWQPLFLLWRREMQRKFGYGKKDLQRKPFLLCKIEKSDILERNYKVRKIEMKRKSG